MPVLPCRSRVLWSMLGQSFTEIEFRDLCFDFGIELDDVTSDKEMYLRQIGSTATPDPAKLAALSGDESYRIDLPANRYDLLCPEGLTTALRVFLGKQKAPLYRTLPATPKFTMKVDPSVLPIRPYVVCAILRNITFDEDRYQSFINIQERLHLNLGRKRSLVSMGTHDLDKVQPPFTYEAMPKREIDFLPLKGEADAESAPAEGADKPAKKGNLKGDKIEEYYKNDKHIGPFVPLISHFDNFPVILDAQRRIMSLPPIINSDFSKITLDTKNVFIEVTATDLTKANIFLNMVITAFSEYTKEKHTVEPVEIQYPADHNLKWLTSPTVVTPDLSETEFTIDQKYINSSIGIDASVDDICGYLSKMMLRAEPKGDAVVVKVPCTRADVLHKVDVMEDVAIAYGYEKLLREAKPPQTLSYGKQQPREAMRNLLRSEMGFAGFTEILTFSLCAREEATVKCRRSDDFFGGIATVEEPKTVVFQCCRPSLMPGTLKTLAHSKDQPLPISLFEVTDVVLMDPKHRIGARNETHICALRCARGSAGFDLIHGTFEYTMTRLGIKERSEKDEDGWYIEAGDDDAAFYPGWQANLCCFGKRIGTMGVVHPLVLKEFGIALPCSYMEYSIEPFLA
ncbi:Phenylalanine--tRNA ligase beta subunit [Diplonema papillatum]|nr:Phenylalanine--tRNA ligase beta subunit [Diplonema papillatum]